MSKPVIRLYHAMARTGGTVIARCLGSMDGVVLLSEIHPRGLKIFNPVVQAGEWFDLFTAEDKARLRDDGTVDYVDVMALIHARCEERDKMLVIRDWTHLDFIGLPFVSPPPYQPTNSKILENRFRVINAASVRHPIDQWLSFRKFPVLRGKVDSGFENYLSLETFLKGCRHFAEVGLQSGFIQYEDFTSNPDAVLEDLCGVLDIPFDYTYRNRWQNYGKITGDVESLGSTDDIVSRARPAVEPELINRFAANSDYQRTIEILGYSHPN